MLVSVAATSTSTTCDSDPHCDDMLWDNSRTQSVLGPDTGKLCGSHHLARNERSAQDHGGVDYHGPVAVARVERQALVVGHVEKLLVLRRVDTRPGNDVRLVCDAARRD